MTVQCINNIIINYSRLHKLCLVYVYLCNTRVHIYVRHTVMGSEQLQMVILIIVLTVLTGG